MKNSNLRIESVRNPRIKAVVKLRDRSQREKTKSFGVEGIREIDRAVSSGFQLKTLFVCKEILPPQAIKLVEKIESSASESKARIEVIELNRSCFDKIVVREGFDGLYAIFEQKTRTLQEIWDPRSQQPSFLVLEEIEKPGNLGALLRSADAAKVTGVILVGRCGDPFSPQSIRSSLGTVFSTPICKADLGELKSWLQQHGIALFAASLKDRAKPYTDCKLGQAAALALGSEANGLSAGFYELGGQLVKLPMLGIADSLNVSVAGAVLIYESLRQKLATRG